MFIQTLISLLICFVFFDIICLSWQFINIICSFNILCLLAYPPVHSFIEHEHHKTNFLQLRNRHRHCWLCCHGDTTRSIKQRRITCKVSNNFFNNQTKIRVWIKLWVIARNKSYIKYNITCCINGQPVTII